MTMTSVMSPYLVKYSLRLSVIIKRWRFIFQNSFFLIIKISKSFNYLSNLLGMIKYCVLIYSWNIYIYLYDSINKF